jgi:hypothetical protein
VSTPDADTVPPAQQPMPAVNDSGEGILDRSGEWEIRATIYRNGRRVGTCDTAGWETFDQAAYWAAEGLQTREIDLHQPKSRTKP